MTAARSDLDGLLAAYGAECRVWRVGAPTARLEAAYGAVVGFVEQLRAAYTTLLAEHDGLTSIATQLSRENERLRADAARLEWVIEDAVRYGVYYNDRDALDAAMAQDGAA